MNLSPHTVIVLAVLLPMLTAALAPWIQRFVGGTAGWALAIAPIAGFVGLWGLIDPVSHGEPVNVVFGWAPSWGIDLAFRVDGLSLTFSMTIAAIGALILIYTGSYLKGHAHQGRFFTFMLLFMGAMQGLVLADNVVGLYMFWELTSVTSFLLIGFDHSRQAARRAATQALVVTGMGGLALLGGGLIMHQLSGTWTLSEMPSFVGEGLYPLIVLLVLLAAFTKSAQVPFHFWLPNAMEAPTPVSAYLHSAAMVQGGVYLTMRLSPQLGGADIWNGTLMVFGGITLLWGAIAALRQTDMKQMLAQTTLASLGLLILLVGIGTEYAIMGAMLYFLAHAAYKAGLFLVVGAIDHETGTREITAVGGLRDKLTVTFIGAIMAGAGMLGLPPVLAFFAKEEMYIAGLSGDPGSLVALVVLVIGNALMGAIGLALIIRPFMGALLSTPKSPHEAPVAMLAGPILLGALALVAGLLPGEVGHLFVAPGASAITAHEVESHLSWGNVDVFSLAFLLSLLTWVLAGLTYWRLDATRSLLRRLDSQIGYSFDQAFDAVYFGLVNLAAAVTRTLHHGRLEVYLTVVFFMLALVVIGPLWLLGGIPRLPAFPDLRFYEWGVIAMAAIGLVTVVVAQTRLFAILALGVQGLAVAALYLLFGAPDLSFTQFMVEILSVVILALVMTRLQLESADPRPLEDFIRDGAIALMCGLSLTMLLFTVLDGTLDPRLGDFFNLYSVHEAHGHNIVNVILVDFRGLDTLGEICVVMTAGIAILALIRGARKVVVPGDPEPRGPKLFTDPGDVRDDMNVAAETADETNPVSAADAAVKPKPRQPSRSKAAATKASTAKAASEGDKPGPKPRRSRKAATT